MSGRIRTLKPEWLEDEALISAGLAARVLSAALILLADDHGRGRGSPMILAGQVFAAEDNPRELAAVALEKLRAMGFVEVYSVRGQTYFAIRNWEKHQRVDRPGQPRVPGPDSADFIHSRVVADMSRAPRETLATDLDLRSGSPISDPDHDQDAPHDDEEHFDRESSEQPDPVPRFRDPAGIAPPGEDPDALPPVVVPAVGKKPARPDLDSTKLEPREQAVMRAVVGDASLVGIVTRPAELARDLCAAGPGVDVVAEVVRAGAWLRQNPGRAKKHGGRFLLSWIVRAQERGPRRPAPAMPPQRTGGAPPQPALFPLESSPDAVPEAAREGVRLHAEMLRRGPPPELKLYDRQIANAEQRIRQGNDEPRDHEILAAARAAKAAAEAQSQAVGS